MTKSTAKLGAKQDLSWSEVLTLSKTYLKIPLALLFVEAIYWFITQPSNTLVPIQITEAWIWSGITNIIYGEGTATLTTNNGWMTQVNLSNENFPGVLNTVALYVSDECAGVHEMIFISTLIMMTDGVSQKIKFKIVNIDKDTKRISLSYKATTNNPWDKIKEQIGKEVKIKINNITDKAIFGDLVETKLSGMLHYKEISYQENIEDLKKFKKSEIINVKIIEVKDDKIRFSKRALDKDPLDWFKENSKKTGDIITTRIHEVLKTGVKSFNRQR